MRKSPILLGLTLMGGVVLVGCDAGDDEMGAMPPAEERSEGGAMGGSPQEGAPPERDGFGGEGTDGEPEREPSGGEGMGMPN